MLTDPPERRGAADAPARPGVRWLAALAVATVPLVAIGLTYLAWRDRLPDPLPSHWGPGGRMDDTADRATMVAVVGVIAAVGALAAAAGALVTGWRHRIRRLVVAAGAGTGALGAAIWLMTVVLAWDAATAAASASPTWQPATVPVAVLGWAALAYAVCPPPPPYPAATTRPAAQLPRIELPDGEPAVFSELNRPPTAAYVVAGGNLVVAVGLAVWASPWAGLPLLPVSVLIVWLSTTRLTVDARGVRTGFGPWGWPRVLLPLREVAAAELTEVRPIEWGGWGYRIRPDGARGLILRRGPGVRLVLSAGREFVANTRDPDTVAGLVNALLDRAPR